MKDLLLVFWFIVRVVCEEIDRGGYDSQRMIYITNEAGARCTHLEDRDLLCPSILQAFTEVKGDFNNTTIYMFIDNNLDMKLELKSINNFRMTYDHDRRMSGAGHATIRCIGVDAGLSFIHCQNVTIDFIYFQGCGVKVQSNRNIFFKPATISTSLYFENSSFIYFDHVNIDEATGYGLYLRNCHSNITLLNVDISRNHVYDSSLSGETSMYIGGGIILLPDKDNRIPVNFYVRYCTLFALTAYKPEKISNLGVFGKGAAISLFLSNSNNKIRIQDSDFNHNLAIHGGAIYMEVNKGSKHNKIRIDLCSFYMNVAKVSGGAIEYYTNEYPYLVDNTLNVLSATFSQNKAGEYGGGFSQRKPRGYHEVPNQNLTFYQTILTECSFVMNSAKLGSAIYLDDVYVLFSSDSEKISLLDQNNIYTTSDVIGLAALYSYSSDIFIEGTFNCNRNYLTGIVLDFTNLWVNGTLSFQENQGNNGGALSMYEESTLKLLEQGVVYFVNNHAGKGGALYVQYDNTPVRIFNEEGILGYHCFFEKVGFHWKRKVVYFSDNKASDNQGISLYATTLRYCDEQVLDYFNISLSHINTDPKSMALVDSDWSTIHPGEPINANVILHDELQNNVSALVKIFINDTNVEMNPDNELYLVTANRMKITLVSPLDTPFELTITPMFGLAGAQTITARIKSCAFGYGYDKVGKRCLCQQNDKIVQCEGNDVFMRKNLWVNANSTANIFTCPQMYCKCNQLDCLYQPGKQCSYGRDDTSRLCGKCVPGKTVGIGGEKCIDCSSKLLHRLGILWIIPTIVIVTFISVFILIKLKVGIYENYFNSTFYFYQVVYLFFDVENVDIIPAMWTVTGVINLSGLSIIGNSGYCLLSKFSELDKLFFNYCIPMSAFFGIYVFSKLGQRFTRFQAKSGNYVHAIVFVIVWAYSDLVRLTFNMFKYIEIGDTKYVFIEPSEIYFSSTKHCIYASFGIIMFIIILMFPLMLILSPFLVAQRKLGFTRMIAIFDCFKFCFKEDWFSQGFASYFFICRIVLATIKTFAFPGDVRSQSMGLTQVSLCIYIFFLLAKPYNDRHGYLNYYDGFVLFLLTSVAVMAHGMDSLSPHHPSVEVYNILINVALWIPLLWVVGNLIRRLYRWSLLSYSQWRYNSNSFFFLLFLLYKYFCDSIKHYKGGRRIAAKCGGENYLNCLIPEGNYLLKL